MTKLVSIPIQCGGESHCIELDTECHASIINHSHDDVDLELTMKDLCPEYELNGCISMYKKIDDLIWSFTGSVDGSTDEITKSHKGKYEFVLHMLENPTYVPRSIRAVYLATVIKELIKKGNVVDLLSSCGTDLIMIGGDEAIKRAIKTIDFILNKHGDVTSMNFEFFTIHTPGKRHYIVPSVIKFVNLLGQDMGWMFNRILIHNINMKDEIDTFVPYYRSFICGDDSLSCEDSVVWFGKIAIDVLNSEARRLGCGS